MPSEIKVGPPLLTISQGRTFMVTDPSGEIDPMTSQGMYAMDTRFVSHYRLLLNHTPLTLINSSQITFFAARLHLTNPILHLDNDTLAAHTLRLTLNRTIGDTLHEDLDLANYSGKRVHFLLELDLRSDFADIFRVHERNIVRQGNILTHWDQEKRCLRTSYENADFHRTLLYSILSPVSVSYANGRVCFELDLAPNQHWHACTDFLLDYGQTLVTLARACPRLHTNAPGPTTPATAPNPRSDFAARQERWQARCTAVTSSNELFARMYRQAIEDMGALRIYDMDVSDEAWVPAAGVPWFITLFGRDSLLASYQNMSVSAGFARGALKRLAEYQARERDDWRDAQPGKILHEIRFGELAHSHLIPHTPFYGTADATILYLIVLSEAYRWTGDRTLLDEYRPVAQRCLEWIDHYGDLDGDGLQEYKSFTSPIFENMGWKDSGEAVMYADGRPVAQPKALCELQAYVYDAKIRMAEIFQALGETERATTLLVEAERLKHRFNEAFWMEDEGCYAYGLDPAKQQITTVVSNAGYSLWGGIADPSRAKRTAERLLQPDMWSGWGIRTLSALHPSYNPFSYQCGSIWPQDNAILAEGMKRYGLRQEANYVLQGIFEAFTHFEAFRPPEVFAGVQREEGLDFPILYPGGANIPQAWATGSIFHMLRVILGLRADAPSRRLFVRPTLPDWLSDITLHHLQVGRCLLTLRFWREGPRSRWQVVQRQALDTTTTEDLVEVLEA